MPYINEELLEDEEQDPQSQQISSSSQVIGSGTGGSPQADAIAKKGGGQFTNIDEYLRVNQPLKFGEQLAGKVGEDVTKAGESIDKIGQDFRARADQSSVRDNPELIGRATGADATNFAKEQGNVDEWNKIFNAKYSGPAEFQDAPDLASSSSGAVKTATGKAGAAGTEGGRFALIDAYYGRPSSTQGQKALDNLLVQTDPNADNAFDQVRENANALARRASDQEKELTAYGTSARGTTEAARKAAREAIGVDDAGNYIEGAGAIGAVDKQANEEFERRTREQGLDFGALDTFLGKVGQGGGNLPLTPQQQALLGGVDGLRINGRTYGVDPRTYLSKPNLTKEATSSAAEQERMATLAKLAGVENTFLPDSSSAGTLDDEAVVNFDRGRYTEALGNAKVAYEAESGPLWQRIDQISRRVGELNEIIRANSPLGRWQGPGYLRDEVMGELQGLEQEDVGVKNSLNAVQKKYGFGV